MFSPRVFVLLALQKYASATIGVDIVNGVTHLYGNSFGVAGINLTYDYIIVGGGTAGNAVAARLALAPQNYSVAVIEPGNFYETLNGNRTQVPGYDYTSALTTFVGAKVQGLTVFDLQTEPQAGYDGRQLQYVGGMTWGGSSATNYMGYMRPTVGTFDHWSSEVDDDFWSWDNVYPAYKKSVNFTAPNYSKIGPGHNISYDPTAFDSQGGPLQVSYGNYVVDYAGPLGRAMDSLGFPRLAGVNSGKLLGWGASPETIDAKSATRSSSETSFLQLAASRTNIKLYPNAIAEKVLFDSNRRATGVMIKANSLFQNFDYQLNARREVILSAGAWHSPQLLMLSGIGPAATLRAHNIPVVADVPGVGQNEQDQPFMATSWKVNVTTGTQIAAGNAAAFQQATNQFLNTQSGPLSSIGGGEAIGFEKFPQNLRSNFSNTTLQYLARFPSDWPEAEYLPLTYSSYPNDVGTNDYYMDLGSAMFATKSRGNMTISSNSILDPPVISPNWLLDPADGEQAVAALKRIRQIMHASGIVLEEYQPGPSVQTDAEILAWLRNNMVLIYHSASNCKMGNSTDPTAVVDSRARVRGVTGLRVVDASAFPFLPPGQPMSTVYMFAEKIAESILSGQ